MNQNVPTSTEAEEAALGAILLSPDILGDVAEFLKPEHFYLVRNGWIFQAMLTLHNDNSPIDELTLAGELKRTGRYQDAGGAAYLTKLINATPSSRHAYVYARMIERTALRRRLLTAAGEIAAAAQDAEMTTDEIMDKADSILFGVTSAASSQSMTHISDALEHFMDSVKFGGDPGLPTGIDNLDEWLIGMEKGSVISLAGRPGDGKTSLAISIVLNVARMFESRVAVFSLEMTRTQLMRRIAAAEAGIDNQRLRRGSLTTDEWQRLDEAGRRLRDLPIYIDDTSRLSVESLKQKARKLHREKDLDLIVIDYLGLLVSTENKRNANREAEVAAISNSIKALAKELNIPILLLVQMNRYVEHRGDDNAPQLSDLRESGAIEADSSVVMFLRPEKDAAGRDTGKVNVHIAKNREGKRGVVSLAFRGERTQFVGMQKIELNGKGM